jgi:hypothetical protein
MKVDIATVGTWVAFILTLMVYCYLGKDIPFLHFLYRVAAYTFIGVALGYAAIMAWHGVLVPRLWLRLAGGQWWYIVPMVLCLLLLSRVRRSWSELGSVTLAFIFGVGAALAIGGGIAGTLLPQVRATFVSLNPADYEGIAAYEGNAPALYVLDAAIVVLGTITALMYSYFATGTRASGQNHSSLSGVSTVVARAWHQVVRLTAGFGRVFIMCTFGALFATAAISRFSLLVDRIRFLLETLWHSIPVP